MKHPEPHGASWLVRCLAVVVVFGLPLTVTGPFEPRPEGSSVAAPAEQGTPGIATSVPAMPTSAPPDLGGYVQATPHTAAVQPEIHQSPPSHPSPVTKIVNDPRCGPGSTSVSSRPGVISCFHSALDPMPEIAQPVAQAAKAAPVCMGNGVNGPRIQLIYMYVEGQPNRSAQVIPRILNDIVPRMEGTFRETSRSQGREIGMRLHMPGCKPTVDTVMIDGRRGQPDDPFLMSGRIDQALRDAGFGSTDRKFVLWFDGGNGTIVDGKLASVCGIAPGYAPKLEQGLNPTPANTSNIGWHKVMIAGEVAITFRYGIPILGDAPIPPPPPPRWPGDIRPAPPPEPECWGRGAMGARTETHELLHNIGAVGLSAPNSNGFGHCTDDLDIMCYGERGVSTVPRCASPVELLDCGADDYFNARPQAGSYLSRAWNTANSRFLGEAIVHDRVPIEIPRP